MGCRCRTQADRVKSRTERLPKARHERGDLLPLALFGDFQDFEFGRREVLLDHFAHHATQIVRLDRVEFDGIRMRPSLVGR